MELLAAAKNSSPRLPIQSHPKNLLPGPMELLRSYSTGEPSIHRKLSAACFLDSHREHLPTQKIASFTGSSTARLRVLAQNHVLLTKVGASHRITAAHIIESLENHLPVCSHSPLPTSFLRLQFQLFVMSVLYVPPCCFASEAEEISGKINIESILISIDNFFNRYPFFVAGVTFVWLVVIPLTQEYLKKNKYISAISAFRKLKEDPNSQLLDIRKKRSRAYLGSPNLKILNKNVVQVEFSEGQEDDFVKEVLKNFQDPSNTVVCVLDNFDGDSLKVAELLFNKGFKEAYAIKGGLRGKDGWQAIQETLLPPSVQVYPRKKKKSSCEVNTDSERINKHDGNNSRPQVSSENPQGGDNGQVKAKGAASGTKHISTSSSSPYPNYPDLKPPSSPTPSKPQ